MSWALPRGVPDHPDENRLAVHTEDHPLEYLEFEGDIPKGEYGAGTMRIWDGGTFEAEKWRDGEVIAVFHGERMKGRYALFRTREDDWMIHRMDPPDDPGYEPLPDRIAPMLARSGKLSAQRGAVRLRGQVGRHPHRGVRRPRAQPAAGPQLLRLHAALSGGPRARAGARGAPDRPRRRDRGLRRAGPAELRAFQSRMHLASDSAVRRRVRDIPVTYVIFDLLYLDGHSTMSLSYEQRRELLDELALEGPSWRTPAYQRGEGRALQQATRELGSRGSWPRSSTAVTNPAAAPRTGSRSPTAASRTW